MTPRERRVARAQRLRAQGLTLCVIGERMGVAYQTVHAYLSDPDGSKLKARKDTYRGTCSECGGPTDGSYGPGRAPTRCIECITWTREQIVAAMRRWAAEHGSPPRCEDWRHAQDGHPTAGSARRFGWNECLLDAGLPLRHDHRPETQEWIEQQVREGARVVELAERLGVTPAAIYMRFKHRETSVSALRQAA